MSSAGHGRPRHADRRLLIVIIVVVGAILAMRDTDSPWDNYVALRLDDHPPGTAKAWIPSNPRYEPFYVTHAIDGELYALIRKDPYNDCNVSWLDESQRFTDECNGNLYDIAGQVVEAPAQRGLDRYHIERQGEDGLLVDLDRALYWDGEVIR